MAEWRIIEDGAGQASWNMALDEALFESAASNDTANDALPVLRLYQWNVPAISLGRFQNVERTIQTENCRRYDVPLVRRITGGRGILHGDDLTISATAKVGSLGLSGSVSTLEIYTLIARCFIAALETFGFQAAMGTCSRERARGDMGDCFACVSQADVIDVKTGRKLLGAALHRRDHYFLMQASIPLYSGLDRPGARTLFYGKTQPDLPAPEPMNAEALRSAIRHAFIWKWQITLREGPILQKERIFAENLVRQRYGCEDWNTKNPGNRIPLIDSRNGL